MAKCSENDRAETPGAPSSALEIHHNKQISIIYSWLGCNLLLQILVYLLSLLTFFLKIHYLCTFLRKLWRGDFCQSLGHPLKSSTVWQFAPLTAWQPAVGIISSVLLAVNMFVSGVRKSCLKQLWSKSCGAPHAPGPSRLCQFLLWKMTTRAGTSHHPFLYPPDSVAFTSPLHLHSSLSQLSYLAFSLNPCTRFPNGHFLARSQEFLSITLLILPWRILES